MMTMGKASQSKYPSQFSGHLTAELDENLASLDGNTYKVWSCLNRLLDSSAVNCQGYYLGYSVRITQANIAERVNLSIATVKRCLKRLEDASIIEVERPTFGCNRYRLTSFRNTIEAHPTDPAIPSMETIAQYERGDSITGELSRAHSYDPPIAQSCEPHNRPVLTDQSIVNSLSTPVPEEAKTDDKVETNRERDLATLFYEEVLERPLTDTQKRKRINRDFKRLISDIASDERVRSPEAAREVLIDAFPRVKRKAGNVWSHLVMTTGYGEEAIEAAILARLTSPVEIPTEAADEHKPARREPSINDRIERILCMSNYRDLDHAVLIVLRRSHTITREQVADWLASKESASKREIPPVASERLESLRLYGRV